MMNIVLALVSLLLTCALSVAQMTEKDMKSAAVLSERTLKLDAYISKIEKGEVDARKLSVIYLVLKHTSEYHIHCMRGATGNKVYLHPEGHQEAVFDADGKRVEDGINDASYNYFHPIEEPLLHYSFDILPWVLWGSTATDPTSVDERIYAYMGDLEAGIMRAYRDKDALSTLDKETFDSSGQSVALAVFLKAIELGEAERLYGLFKSNDAPSSDALIATLKSLHDGLTQVYPGAGETR